MSKKLDALLKNFGTETVAVIHSLAGPRSIAGRRIVLKSSKIVALVTVDKTLSIDDKLEKAFILTNSIDDAWWNNKNVTKLFDGDSCRSTMVGDMIMVGKVKYNCKSSGWSRI